MKFHFNKVKFKFEKQSTDSGLSDFTISIHGWILFSFLAFLKSTSDWEFDLVIFNYKILEIQND